MQLSEVEQIAALPGEPRSVSAAGVTKSGVRLVTLENGLPFDATSRRRIVIVAWDDRAVRAALGAIRWFKTQASASDRERWSVSALLLGSSDDAAPTQTLQFPPVAGFFNHSRQPESRYVWRWATYQAPDLLLEIRGSDVLSTGRPPAGSLAAAMAGGTEAGTVHSAFASVRDTDGTAALQHAFKAAEDLRGSELRATLGARVSRRPVAIAQTLAARYPLQPAVSYIPSIAWATTLRLADIIKEERLRQKVLREIRPWLTRDEPLFGRRISLTEAAGAMVYADLAERGEPGARELAVQGADAALPAAANGIAQNGQGWTDDMFMSAAILARTGTMPGRESDLDRLAALLISYAGRLQSDDGIFVHFTDGRVAWGRGNGFAALGLMEALTSVPANHGSRAQLLEIYRRQMNGLRTMQAPDGMWRQVVDEPGAYREASVTAMTLTAMARGVRLGWLDKRYLPSIERAWHALAAHITEDGAIIDVCAGTGSGPTLRYYLDRPAISGPDDRGGAMALMAAVEMMELQHR